MSQYGIRHLRKLAVSYCDLGGSSRGIRKFIRDRLIKLAEENPDVTFETLVRRNKHPNLRASYLLGTENVVNVENQTSDEIENVVSDLRNQTGRRVSQISRQVYSQRPSIQGTWHERWTLADVDFSIETYVK